MLQISDDVVMYFADILPHLFYSVGFILSATSSKFPDASDTHDPPELHNLLAPPIYVFCMWYPLMLSLSLSIPDVWWTDSLRTYDIEVMKTIAVILAFPVTTILESYMLFGCLRMYTSPVAVALMWIGVLYLVVKMNELRLQSPLDSREMIKFALGKLSIHITFAWLTGAVIFVAIDTVQYFHGGYFCFAVYGTLMAILLFLAGAAYIHSQDLAVPWIACWFLVGLEYRQSNLDGEEKKTLKNLQAIAFAAKPVFLVFLVYSICEGQSQLLAKVRLRVDNFAWICCLDAHYVAYSLCLAAVSAQKEVSSSARLTAQFN
ncbi:unnamed protein product [Phytophthora lilii]|uniref:Unnamed protein product n=1 Tax=Phytophthora lilii TaxID=2077276 RepID=A0A9W6WNG8_9STRA|nr:unnamed protein product [Phytophthora lilii]